MCLTEQVPELLHLLGKVACSTPPYSALGRKGISHPGSHVGCLRESMITVSIGSSNSINNHDT